MVLNFKDAIKQASATDLSRLAKTYGLKETHVETLREHLLQKASAPTEMATLSAEQLTALRLVFLNGGTAVIEPCLQKLGSLYHKKGFWARDKYAYLLGNGFLFTNRKQYREIFEMPEEVYAWYAAQLYNDIRVDSLATQEQPQQNQGVLILNDLAILLGRLQLGPLRLTQRGHLYQKDLSHLLNIFTAMEIHDVQGHTYPPRFRFLMQFAEHLGLFQPRDEELFRTEQATIWLNLSESDMLTAVFTYFINELEPMPIFRVIVQMLTGAEHGISQGKLLELLAQTHLDHSWLAFQKLFLTHMQLAVEIGLIEEFATAGDMGLGWRLSQEGLAFLQNRPVHLTFGTGFNFVGADFEIIIMKNIQPKFIHFLEIVAHLEQADTARHYRLSKESIGRALPLGYSAVTVTQKLQELTQMDLPQNIQYSLLEWESAYGQIEIGPVFLLRCKSEELANRLKMHPEIKAYLQEHLSATDFIVYEKDVPQLFLLIEKEGFALPKSLSHN